VSIGEHCDIRNAIIDEGTVVPDGTTIGVDPARDRERFYVSENGVTLVTASMLRPATR
jgi:glucose-1-phosphate adenylyltransferase